MIAERAKMGNLITTEVAEAYRHCPRKAFLLLKTASPPPPHEYESLCRDRGAAHRERYTAQSPREGREVARGDREGLGAGHRYLVGVDLQASDLSASCDALVRIDRGSSPEDHSYSPLVFAGTYSVTDDHRFALSFIGHLLGLVEGSRPGDGRIITLDGVAHKVALADRYRETASVLAEVRRLADRDATPPPVILNHHCPLCPFRAECLTQAVAADDLSLLDRMTPKAIRRYHKKGIFTVTQLSYLFRPRRRRRGAGASPAFKLELQALAIRTGKIYLQTPPSVVRKGATSRGPSPGWAGGAARMSRSTFGG
jgi:predicted RecB family nuclease